MRTIILYYRTESGTDVFGYGLNALFICLWLLYTITFVVGTTLRIYKLHIHLYKCFFLNLYLISVYIHNCLSVIILRHYQTRITGNGTRKKTRVHILGLLAETRFLMFSVFLNNIQNIRYYCKQKKNPRIHRQYVRKCKM